MAWGPGGLAWPTLATGTCTVGAERLMARPLISVLGPGKLEAVKADACQKPFGHLGKLVINDCAWLGVARPGSPT